MRPQAEISVFVLITVSLFEKSHSVGNDEAPSGFQLQFREGHVLIGGAIEVHRHNSDGCSELRSKGVQDVETINMLIDQVNANESILPGIELGTVLIDTCAWPTHAVRRVVTDLLPLVPSFNSDCNLTRATENGSAILAGVVGAGTSRVSMQLANLLQVFWIPQISHTSTIQELSDKTLYPYFFRTVSADINQARAMIRLVKKMGWNFISVVYEENCYGRNAFLEFEIMAKREEICIATSISIKNDATDGDYIKTAKGILSEDKAKVVIVYTKTTPAEKVISATNTLSNRSLIWVGSDGWATYLPKNKTDNSYVDSLDGAIAFRLRGGHQARVDKYIKSITLEQRQGWKFHFNPWFSEYLAMEKNCSLNTGDVKMRKCDPGEMVDPGFKSYGGLLNLVHAVTAFVQALDAYHREICEGERGVCSAMSVSAGKNEFTKTLRDYLRNVSFPTDTGMRFLFDQNQNGPTAYDIMTYRKDNVKDHLPLREGWAWTGTYEDGEIKFPNGLPEKARVTISICSEECGIGQGKIKGVQQVCCWHCVNCTESEFVSPNTSLCEKCPVGEKPNKAINACIPLPIEAMNYAEAHSIVPLCLGTCGIVCAFLVVAIFVLHIDSAIVRASGKELCFLLLFGAILTFCNCFAFTAPPSMFSCVASRFILAFGPTLMYAALLVKTVRVVIIFKLKTALPSRVQQSLQPVPQALITLSVAMIQIFTLIGWFMVRRPNPQVQYGSDIGFLSCPGITNVDIFVGLVYPFLLVLVCTVLATINRDAPDGFNETLLIGFTMYTTCVIWLAFLPLFLINSSNMLLKITTSSVCLSLSALAVLICLFVPRCYKILFRPEENTRKAVMSVHRSTELDVVEVGMSQSQTPRGGRRTCGNSATAPSSVPVSL